MSRLARRAAWGGVLAFLAAALVLGPPRQARPVAPPIPLRPAATASADPTLPLVNVVRQGFPARSADPRDLTRSDTAWEVEWEITNPTNKPNSSRPPSSVLKILAARFMYRDRANRPRWITVLRNLELGEMFVPYDPGSPRYNDVAGQSFWIMRADPKLLGPACVAAGEILPSADPTMHHKVYKEVHDDGLRWLSDGGAKGPDRGRRGEKMLLWAVFNGGNYRYIIEYGFSDDGTITPRVGATARNHHARQDDGRDVHLHVGCWMFDPELTDPADPGAGGRHLNRVSLVRRLPRNPGKDDGLFRVDVQPFNSSAKGPALEGGAVWVPEEFTTLRIESTTRKNGNNPPQSTAYDLIAVRSGSVRNFPTAQFEWVNRDFWVTRQVPGPSRYIQLPTYVGKPPRPLDGKPVTVWHCAPLWHVSRAEDFGPDGRSNTAGVALTAWASFVLRPRNLFDRTPLYGP